jgi:hypothetical protein
MNFKKIWILFMLYLIFIFYDCDTNPPNTTDELYPKGKIFLTTKIYFDNTSIPVSKVILLEDFANVSCVPCVTSNQIIESLVNVTYGSQKIAVIKFPTNFPSSVDPFYLANEHACDLRMKYYNILSVPTLIVDGTLRPIPSDSNNIKGIIDDRLNQKTSFNITVDTKLIDSSYFVNVNLQVSNITEINLNDIVLYIVLTETDIEFNEAPGSNGERKFFNVMRKFLPSDEGLVLSSINQTNTFTWEGNLLSVWNSGNLHIVAFVQNIKIKEVLQAYSD